MTTQHDPQVLAALTKVINGQTQVTRLLTDILAEARRPVAEDPSIARLEALLKQLCALLTRSLNDHTS